MINERSTVIKHHLPFFASPPTNPLVPLSPLLPWTLYPKLPFFDGANWLDLDTWPENGFEIYLFRLGLVISRGSWWHHWDYASNSWSRTLEVAMRRQPLDVQGTGGKMDSLQCAYSTLSLFSLSSLLLHPASGYFTLPEMDFSSSPLFKLQCHLCTLRTSHSTLDGCPGGSPLVSSLINYLFIYTDDYTAL